ncbi:MAG: ABC transporter ATP-binding protein [Eubacteriales bacterium]|nr:ABC transporter ATP-binding protein [Eubacteriales bacterium]
MKNIFKNLLPYKKTVALLVVLLLIQAYCDLALPQYTQNIIDVGIQNKGIEHILPEKMTADEYEEAQIFMTAKEKKSFTASYWKSDKKYKKQVIYVRKSLEEEQLTELDDELLTPIVLTYQMGHTSVKNFKDTVKGFIERSAESGNLPDAASSAAKQSAGSSAQAAARAGSLPASAVTPEQRKAAEKAGKEAQAKAAKKLAASIDDMSVAQIRKLTGLKVRTFKAKDENGDVKTYVDMRPAMKAMIDSGAMTESAMDKAKKQLEKTIDSVGTNTLHSMAVTYAAEADEAAGVDVDKIQKAYLWSEGGRMTLMALIMVIEMGLVSFLASRVGAGVSRDLRDRVFTRVMGYSNAEMDKFSTASLITRCTNDVQQVQVVITMFLRIVLYAPIMGIWGILKVAGTGAHMGWIIVLAVLMLIGLVMLMMAGTLPKFRKMQGLVDALNRVSREILTGLLVIRAFGREDLEEERFDKANKELMETQLFTTRVMTMMQPTLLLFMNLLVALITWISAHRIDQGTLQVGAMTAFITYSMMIVMAFLMISVMSIILPRASVAADRIDEVLKTESSITDAAQPEVIEPEAHRGEVTFSRVDFRYPGAEADAIHDIDFTVSDGKTLAIIGSTGSGKSTLVNLIPRFYDVTGGQVLVDGKDVRNLTLKDLRDMIGFVPQKGVLFSGTIASNIRFGNEEAGDDEVRAAAEIAQAEDFIENKEDKYDSAIAQGGSNVSGGQKQRLAIARAIAKKPEILVFDDSFSALDMKTDAKLRQALEDKIKHVTKIIVAQRISTVLHADQIIVLDEGKIVGKGKHEELLKTCDVYREIAESQLSRAELGLEG